MTHYLSLVAIIAWAFVAATADESKIEPLQAPQLRQELLRRVKVDQAARLAMIEWMKLHAKVGAVDIASLADERKAEFEKLSQAVQQADEENTKRLAEIVERYGWPRIALVGKEGANAAWLLVQHADRNRPFQRQCLDLMTQLPKDEVSQRDLAYLTDRVLLAEGKKQVYGTQMNSAEGKWTPQPLEDPDNVDQRRAERGLEPLAEYIKQMESFYGPAPRK